MDDSKITDKDLGMDRGISRRDFLNGVAVTAGASLLPPHLAAALEPDFDPEKAAGYYPPALTGLRGSHEGSFEVAHNVRDGDFWQKAGQPINTGETFDLIVVGGGISGLSAAHFLRKTNPSARILVLDNHDDFGGHAKRNEFSVGERRMLGFGGTFSIESPAPYSAISKALVDELGIDVSSFPKYISRDLYRSLGMSPSIFFDRETFGSDRLVINPAPVGGGETGEAAPQSSDVWKRFNDQAPLSDAAKRDLRRLIFEAKDYYPGLSSDEKKARMARISYAKFLVEVANASPELVKMYQAAPHGLFGVGIDGVAAQDAWGLGLPGFSGMKLDPAPGKGMNRDAIPNAEAEKYFFHFPDGNASIARLLVRTLIPDAIRGKSSTDVVTAKADYARLDHASSPVRIRLNSTAVRVKHVGDPAKAKEVEVTYSRGGKLYSVRAPFAVLACWNMVVPYICAELPEKQKEALHYAAKVPLLYTNVALRNWTAFQKLGVSNIHSPGAYWNSVNLNWPVNIGDYHSPRLPEEPTLLFLSRTPCKPGLPARGLGPRRPVHSGAAEYAVSRQVSGSSRGWSNLVVCGEVNHPHCATRLLFHFVPGYVHGADGLPFFAFAQILVRVLLVVVDQAPPAPGDAVEGRMLRCGRHVLCEV